MSQYGPIVEAKLDLVRRVAQDCKTWRDFGGCYLVHGRYLNAAVDAGATFASMIDLNPTLDFQRMQQGWAIRCEVIKGDFRDHATFASLREVDASILYEVLLHQENYIEVIKQITLKTRRRILIGQPCLDETGGEMPAALLLQFMSDEEKAELRRGTWWLEEATPERFDSSKWMWGHTRTHLIHVMRGFGWRLNEAESVKPFRCGDDWEFPLLSFEPRV